MTSVCPALWPPWKRTTTSARALSQSTILPLPSSPHWAPITATFAIRSDLWNTADFSPVPTARATVAAGAGEASEHQGAHLFDQGKGADFRQHTVLDGFVHLEERDCVCSGCRTPEVEVRDIHPGVA